MLKISHALLGKAVTKLLPAFMILLAGQVCIPSLFSENSFQESHRARIGEIAGMLARQPTGFGKPCSERASWSVQAGPLKTFVDEAQQVVNEPLPPFDSDAYMQYSKTGDRQPMEKNSRERQSQLIPLVLAECVEYKGRYLGRIAEVMDSLAAAPSWTLSAHDPQLLNLHGVSYYVDLNAADLADNLAESLYLLGDKVPEKTRAHVLDEMERHVFAPLRSSFSSGEKPSDHNGNWWLYAEMNWNAVCLKGVTGAALAVLPSVEDRAQFAAAAEYFIHYYENGFNPDGYSTEGLGYWNYGFAHFIELRENMLRVTKGKVDLLQEPKMRKVALFGAEFPMMPGNSAAFGDAGLMPRPDTHLLKMVGQIFSLPASYSEHEWPDVSINHVGLTSIALDLFPTRGDKVPAPSNLRNNELHEYYVDSGILVSRPAVGQALAVTIKAGGNTQHHSHNDIGSFVVGLSDVQPVGDPGGPKYYTASTFGPHRFDSKLLNSFGHPVPEIDGHLQVDAATVKVKVLAHSFSAQDDRIVIDMTPAYDVAQLKQLTRTLVHSRSGHGSIIISDSFHLAKPTVVSEALPTCGTWKKLDEQTLLFSVSGKRLKVRIDAPGPLAFTETKVEYNGRAFTRVAAQIVLKASGKVTIRFMPEEP
jgi:hypothetical protein